MRSKNCSATTSVQWGFQLAGQQKPSRQLYSTFLNAIEQFSGVCQVALHP